MSEDLAPLVARLEMRTAQYERSLQRAERKMNAASNGMSARWSRGMRQMERRSTAFGRQTERTISATTRRINGLLATAGLSIGVAQVIKYGDAWIEAGNKVKSAEKSIGRPLNTLGELKDAAQETRISLTPTVDLYTRLARAGEPLNKSQDDILNTTILLNKAFKAGGAAASEQESAILQLTQAIQSGALQGDEFRSIRENAPLLMSAIAKELGVGKDALKELAREGSITSEVIFAAIEGSAGEIESQFSSTRSTIGESFTYLKNEVISFIGNVDDGTGASERLTSAIISFADTLPERVAGTLTALEAIGEAIEDIGDLIDRVTGEDSLDKIVTAGDAGTELLEKDLEDFVDRRNKLLAKMNDGVPNTSFLEKHLRDELDKLNSYIEVTEDKIAEVKARSINREDYDMRDLLASGEGGAGDAKNDDDGAGGGRRKYVKSLTEAQKKAAAKRLERELAVIEALGRSEREQLNDLLALRFETIDKSSRKESEKAKLREKATQDYLVELADVKQAEDDASDEAIEKAEEKHASDFAANQERLSFIAEIAAATARMSGRALEATHIEMDATRARYEAELAYIDELIAKKGLTPELDADRANAEAGIASVDADEADLKKNTLSGIKGMSDGNENSLSEQLARLDEEHAEKLARLEEYRTTDKELMRAFEEEKLQIEAEFAEKRKELRIDDINSQLDAASKLASTIGRIGKEGSKAQKAAARVQQGIALGRAAVNAAMAVSEAVASAPFPANIPAIAFATAMGGAQIAAIASQGFKDGVVDLQGPGTGRSDSIPAKLSRGESVITAAGTRGNETGLRGLNNGLSPERAFGLSAPSISMPTTNRASYTFGGPSLTVQGNVDESVLPMLQAQLAQASRDFTKNVNTVLDLREKRTVSRTNRDMRPR